MNVVNALRNYVNKLTDVSIVNEEDWAAKYKIASSLALYIIDNAISTRINKRFCNKCTCSDPSKAYDVIGGIIPSVKHLQENEFGTLRINNEDIGNVMIYEGHFELMVYKFNESISFNKPITSMSDSTMLTCKPSFLNPSFVLNIEY